MSTFVGTHPGTSRHLDLANQKGTPVMGVRDTNWKLVKREESTGDFQPVDKLDKALSSEELDAKFGVWVDRKVTEGHLWWKKTVREEDGKVQPDEVRSFDQFRNDQISHVWHRMVGGDELYTCEAARVELHPTPSGTYATLETTWNEYRGDWSRYWEPWSPLAPQR